MRREAEAEWLRPDGKSQVTVEYDENGVPLRAHTIVVSTQHAPGVALDEIRGFVRERVVRPTMPADLYRRRHDHCRKRSSSSIRLAGSRSAVPQGDCGLTGRKIIVDTYGGVGHHGGGAFSGKDPTKVDRSASYMARYVAKNLVAAGMADRLEVQLAYAIGVAKTGFGPRGLLRHRARGALRPAPRGDCRE